MDIVNMSTLLTIIGAITVVTNIVTEVLKKVTWDKLPTNVLVVIIAQVLTLASGAAYAQINGIKITWYMVFAAVVVGILVAYAAMFGFDKLKETLAWIKTGKGGSV